MTTYRMDFESLYEARKALAKLKEFGFNNSYLDVVENYNEEFAEEININIPQNVPCYSSAILRSGRNKATLEKAPLVANNPLVSGVGSLCELAGNRAASLFVTIQSEKLEEIKNILKDLKM